MKKLILILLLCPLLMQAQEEVKESKADKRIFKGLFIVGLNATQVDGDNMAGYRKFGLNAGVGTMMFLNKKRSLSLSMELLYSQRGAQSATNISKTPSYRKIVLDYAEIPLIFSFHDKKIAMFGAGISVAGLARAKHIRTDDLGNVDYVVTYQDNDGSVHNVDLSDNVNRYQKIDLSAVANVTFFVPIKTQKIGVNLRFQYSMLNLANKRTDPWGYTGFPESFNFKNRAQYNNGLSFRLMYIL